MAPTGVSNRRPASSTKRICFALLAAGVLSCPATYARADEGAKQYTYADLLASHYADADELPGSYAYADELGGPSRSRRLPDSHYTPVTLEKAFWACDHAATTRGVVGWEALSCSEIYEDVKRTKFSGDFQAMLTWWKKNKTAKHQAVEEANGLAAR